ncbi:hypothetical protein WA158_001269 [Blastocystis sp. Blastoise]
MKTQIVLALFLFCYVYATNKPNIVFIIADDMGWSDAGFRNNDQIHTPTLDSFVDNRIILERYYAQDVCSPTRASILTGRYPSHYGMQHNVLLPKHAYGVPLNETYLPSVLKDSGYNTHAIGKWHQGFYKWEYTPTFRGFETYYGYWNGAQTYSSHMKLDG